MTLEKLHLKVIEAENAMRVELESRYPVDSTIFVYLHSKQQIPSAMTVQSHNGQGYVRACMDSKKARYGLYVKDIYFTDIAYCQGSISDVGLSALNRL